MQEKTYLNDIIIEEIKIGDIHYEFFYNKHIKAEVLTEPVLNGNLWEWTSKKINDGDIINYSIDKNSTHYLKLYKTMAYFGTKEI